MVWLGQEMVDPECQQGDLVLVDDCGRADHHRLVWIDALDPPADLNAGKHGPVEGNQGKIKRSLSREFLDTFGSVGGLDHPEALAAQILADELSQNALIFDQKEA